LGQRLGPAKRIYTSKTDGNSGKSEANSGSGNQPGVAKTQGFSVDFENWSIFLQFSKSVPSLAEMIA